MLWLIKAWINLVAGYLSNSPEWGRNSTIFNTNLLSQLSYVKVCLAVAVASRHQQFKRLEAVENLLFWIILSFFFFSATIPFLRVSNKSSSDGCIQFQPDMSDI